MTTDDVPIVAQMLADPEVMRYYPHVFNQEEAAGWVDRAIADYRTHGHGRWLILLRETGKVVGQVGLLPWRIDGGSDPEIVWMVDQPFWRQGFATEAARATIDLAFGRFDYPRVIAMIRPENLASIAVAEGLGMNKVERIIHADLVHDVYQLRSERP